MPPGFLVFLCIVGTFAFVGAWYVFKMNTFIYNLVTNKYWTKPFRAEWASDYSDFVPRKNECEFRYNTLTRSYQIWIRNSWKAQEHVSGSPLKIRIVDFHNNAKDIEINLYDHFSNPCKPTEAELALFEVEQDYDYTKAVKYVRKLIK